jgi:hypothetical protein
VEASAIEPVTKARRSGWCGSVIEVSCGGCRQPL